MNNNPAQGPAPGGQQAHPQQARPIFFRPEQMRNLPEGFTPEEKKKWENGLIMLYKQMETHPQESQQHLDARKKVQEFSISLQKKIHQNRVQQAQGQSQAQAQGQGQPPQNQAAPQPQAQGDAAAQNQTASQQNRPAQGGLKPPEHIMNHINTFPYALPPQITPGTPEATKWLQEAKNKYGKALLAMENSSNHLRILDAMVKERTEKGNPLNENELKDYQVKKEQYQKNHVDAKRYSEGFRRQQEQQNAAMAASGQQNGMASQPAPQRPTMNLNQQAPNAGIPSSESVNAAIQAARNSSINAGRPPTAGQPGQQNEQAPSGQGVNALSSNGQPIKTEGIKIEGGTTQPQINTAIATAPHMQASMSRAQNSPHSAVPQSATSTGPPRPLTQQAALSQAARTYSSSQTSATPNVMGSHSHPSVARETPNINAVKMPISKQLPPGAIGTPQPVSMAPSRPTMSGGPNGAGSGVMGQPALTKPPGFTLVGDGERVMDKKKLDELVRQVTGGGEGLDSGEALTPEVEDCVLSVADEFVDQVITAACKCAKARGSKTLEIRDIQLILERNYNIRIPGYASDEIRTVRKFQPAQGWIAKMSAIQAAKVTGGKGDN